MDGRMRTVLFWVITQLAVVLSYRRFGTTYRSYFQGSSSHLLRGGSLKSRMNGRMSIGGMS